DDNACSFGCCKQPSRGVSFADASLAVKFSDEPTVCSERGNNGRRQEEGHLEPQGFLDASGLGGVWIFFFSRFARFHSLGLPQSSLSTAVDIEGGVAVGLRPW